MCLSDIMILATCFVNDYIFDFVNVSSCFDSITRNDGDSEEFRNNFDWFFEYFLLIVKQTGCYFLS